MNCMLEGHAVALITISGLIEKLGVCGLCWIHVGSVWHLLGSGFMYLFGAVRCPTTTILSYFNWPTAFMKALGIQQINTRLELKSEMIF